MYTLYFLPGACSLATQVILNELQQPVELIHKDHDASFPQFNPVGTVPVLVDGEQILNEGVAIILHVLNKHTNNLLPLTEPGRQRAIEAMLFANATLHPAYGKLFFIQNTISDNHQQQLALQAAAANISQLWQTVETKLAQSSFIAGEQLTAADIMLAVYSRWGQFFAVDIPLGPLTQAMLAKVMARDSFQQALQREADYVGVAA